MSKSLLDKSPPLSEASLVRFTEKEMERIDAVAKEHGVPRTRVIRVAVQRLLDEQTPTPTKKKRSKK